MANITFLGASETVTGSCYLVEDSGVKFLVDCGMFQGIDVREKNFEDFKFNPAEVSFVLLTHSHIDHSGLLPKLAKFGFKGKIFLTPQTAEITRLLLLDSAKIQEKNSQDNIQSGQIEKRTIYDTANAETSISQFNTINFFDNGMELGVKFTFVPAGHILGAASIAVELPSGKKILFSGDVGRSDQSVIKSFLEYEKIGFDPEYIISESLYGDKVHEDREIAIEKLLNIINETTQRNGNVIIPSFALHRTQEMIEILKIAMVGAKIKEDVQIFLDSPLAISITKIYTEHFDDFNSEFNLQNIKVDYLERKLWGKNQIVLDMPNASRLKFDDLRFIRKRQKSLGLLNKTKRVVLAGSGMADGGRIVHHIYNGIEEKNNSIVFIGFQALETLGRKLVDGATEVQMYDKNLKVKAAIHYIRGFSGHGDVDDLKMFLKRYTNPNLEKVFLVHAEPEVLKSYASNLQGDNYNVTIPKLYENINLE